ncbi:MAG: hypothetical protein ACRC33_01290, partial [Gemmataceae bacterium]
MTRLTTLLLLVLAPFTRADAGKALELLLQLDPAGKTVPLPPVEKRLLTTARDGTLRGWTLEEAALVASGVHDARKRKEHLAAFETLAEEAAHAVAWAKTPRTRGDVLLRFLHAGPLKAYSRYQSGLDALLDGGSFNCVSSAVLYNALGARLGLRLRGVVIPGHAFCALDDGDGRVDVETTSVEGFDPVRKKKRVLVIHRDGVHDLGVRDPSRVYRREVRDAGLTALIYSNRAAACAREKDHLAGALYGLRALCLDRTSPGAAVNTGINLALWAAQCVEQGRYEAGLRAAAVGLAMAPTSAPLQKARLALYRGWAASLATARPDAALDVLRRGVKD